MSKAKEREAILRVAERARKLFWETGFPTPPPVSMSQLQERLSRWQLDNFGEQPAYRQVLGITEEAGETARAVLKREQGIRQGGDDDAAALAQLTKEGCDVIIFVLQLFTTIGVDAGTALLGVAEVVMQRDWVQYPETGYPPEGE